jgi:FKBP-type peptidyl-prolyl cis-trans isomerase (trigger factor)
MILFSNYIKDHNLKVLGQPIPYEVKHQHIDVQQPSSYDFGFEVGLMPSFELPHLEGKPFEKRK